MKQSSTKPVILIGGGGHAKVLLEILRILERVVEGYVSPPNESRDFSGSGLEFLGPDDAVLSYRTEDVELVNGLGSLPGIEKRWELDRSYRLAGYSFATLVHPSAVVASDVELEESVQIMAGVVIQPGVRIGRATIVNSRSSVDHDCLIGRYCHIAPGVTMSGNVDIGDNVHVGTGSSVIHSVRIASDAVIGAGSLIRKDVGRFEQHIQVRDERIENLKDSRRSE